MKLSSFLPALGLCLLLPTMALAQPSAADRATARDLGKEAEAALARKDFPTAADRYGRAEALFHAPTLLLGLARAQAGLGKLVDAAESYRRIVNESIPPNAPPAFAEAQAAAQTELATITPRIAWLTITVSGAEGATVALDGQNMSNAALGVRRAVDPGKHEIVASIHGAVAARQTVTLGEGKAENVPLTLTAPAPGAEPAPVAAPAAAPGSAPAEAKPADAPQDSSGFPRKTLGYVAVGVGGAGIVVGAITGALVLGGHGALVDGCPDSKCPASLESKRSTYNTEGTISTIGFVAGGVLAAAGVVLIVTAPKAGPKVGLTMSPLAGGGAFGAQGTF